MAETSWKITITPRENKDPRVGGSPYHVLIEHNGIRQGLPAFGLNSVVNLISDYVERDPGGSR